MRHSPSGPVRQLLVGCLLLTTCILSGQAIAAGEPRFEVVPGKATLAGNFARVQLVVSEIIDGDRSSDRSTDLTRKVLYLSLIHI